MNQRGASSSHTLPDRARPEADRAQHLVYWAQQIAATPTTIDLPTDRARPLAPSDEQGLCSFTMEPELCADLEALCDAEDATPLMGLVAAYVALLFRYAGNEQFAIGLLEESGPKGSALDHSASSMMVLGADLSGDPSFRTLLRQLKPTIINALARRSHTLDQLVAALGPEYPAGQLPFFQALFSYHSGQIPGATPPAPPLLPPGWSGDGQADLALALYEYGESFAGALGYRADLFDRATAERLAGHFVALLAEAVAAPDTPIADLPLVSLAELAQLEAWNETATPFDLACIHQLIAAQVRYTPNAPALIFGEGRLSYAELDARANQLAHHLRERGVGPERIAAVCMGRGPNLILTLLGILKAGGAYLPLDPVYPAPHLSYMLADARPVVLLSDGELPAGLFDSWQEDAPTPQLVDLTRDAEAIAGKPATPPPDEATLDTLAYVIYTSGSTGRPKGVMLQHRSVATYLLSSGVIYEMTRADRGLHFSSVSFDASVDEIFIPLVHGAALVVTAGHGPPDFAALLELIERHKISVVSVPTAYWHTWIAELSYTRAAPPPSMRLVIIGGEAASGERYNLWRTLVPSVRLINSYGPTETTVASTWYAPPLDADEPAGPMAIGRPLPNERAYILDRRGRLAPLGVVGELYIGGAGLARGYHNRPELTDERFVTLKGVDGEGPTRLYRTGDLARWRNDGELLYNGRADQQVKVRGYRIEPGEIEATLRKHPAVQAAVVVTRPDPTGELMLAGYVVSSQADVTPNDLRAFLDERVPHYMVPAAITVLDALPLTPSGKVDRRALPAPAFDDPAAEEGEAEVGTHVEQVLSRIWQDLLGRRSIGLHENFFDLGGHSLLAMRMLVRVGTELGVKLPVSVMIHSATIASLAEVITREGGSSAWSVLVPIQPKGDRPPLFCVHGFPGDVLWFHELGKCLGPDQPFYGLQSRSLAEGQPHAMSIEQMAAWYNEGMRSVQPEGPYFICGASYGGIVVYEMARQLRALGHEVALVAVLDYDPYAERNGLREQLAGLVEDLRRMPQWMRLEIAPMSATEFRGRTVRRMRLALKRWISLLLGGKGLPVDAADLMHYGSQLPVHRRELLIANDYAFERYTPQPYEGRVTLVASESRYAVSAARPEETGWAPLARGGVDVVFVPGSHETMYKPPYVTHLAHSLRKLVDAGLARHQARATTEEAA